MTNYFSLTFLIIGMIFLTGCRSESILPSNLSSVGIVRVGFIVDGQGIPEPTQADMSYLMTYMNRLVGDLQAQTKVEVKDIMLIKRHPVFMQLPQSVRTRYNFVPLPYKAIKLEDSVIASFLAHQLHVDGLIGLDFTLVNYTEDGSFLPGVTPSKDKTKRLLLLDVFITSDEGALSQRRFTVEFPDEVIGQLDSTSLTGMFSYGFESVYAQLFRK